MKIEIKDKHFSDKIIFRDFSLSIPDGKTTLIAGGSGRGKTTLLRMIAGLDNEYTGSIDAEDAVLLFQEDRLVENMSVKSNLAMVTDDESDIFVILKSLELEGEEKSIVSSLSGGMKRRVAVARVLLLKRKVYLFDEPFTGLDDETKKKTIEVIKERTKGATVVVVSHRLSDISLLGASYRVDL